MFKKDQFDNTPPLSQPRGYDDNIKRPLTVLSYFHNPNKRGINKNSQFVFLVSFADLVLNMFV
jgi:hypothetical protein